MIADISLYLAFIAASIALILLPGPNVAVIVANSANHGVRSGLITVMGTSSAIVIQLGLTVAGLSGLLALAAHSFEALRWAGVAYLIYLAVEAWSAPPSDLNVRTEARSARNLFLRGFVVSLTNPKTLLFYAAFLPQFVSSGADRTLQLVVLAATFFVLSVLLDCCWALLGARARRFLVTDGRQLNRVTGSIFMLAAAGLAFARRP